MKTMTENLIGKTVKINIKNPDQYTSDLYNSIQGKKGVIIEKQKLGVSSYKDAYIVKFGKDALNKYKKTHGGKWSGDNRMEWWTERQDFDVIN